MAGPCSHARNHNCKKMQIFLIIYSFSLPVFIECPSSLFYLVVCPNGEYCEKPVRKLSLVYLKQTTYKSKMNCELNFRFIICCQLNEWNKRLFTWCTINANISSLSVLQLFSEKDWIVTVVIEIDWMITAVSLVFQIRDGLGAKARRSPLPDPTLTKRKIG